MGDANKSEIKYYKEASFKEAIVGVAAQGVLSHNGTQPAAADTIVIDATTYTWQDDANFNPSTADQVLIGANLKESLANFESAVNLAPAGAGVVYGSGSSDSGYQAKYIREDDTVVVINKTVGTAGNGDTLTTDTTGWSFSPATSAGGVNGTQKFTIIPFTGSDLSHAKTTVQSAEIIQDRSVSELIEVGLGAGGGIDIELKYGDYEEFIVAALQADQLETQNDTTLSGDFTLNNTLTLTAGSFTLDTLNARWIKLNGSTNNDGIYKIESISSSVLVVKGTPWSNDATETGMDTTVRFYRNGITKPSYIIEREITDPNAFMVYRGMSVSLFSISAESQERVTGRVEFLGSEAEVRTGSVGDGAPNATSGNDVIVSSNNVADVLIDGSPVPSFARVFEMEINNNLRERPALGQKGSLNPGSGTSEITGRLESYFSDKSQFDWFVEHDKRQVEIAFTDNDGNLINIYLPRVMVAEGNPEDGGLNTDVTIPIEWQATKDPTLGYQCQIDILPI